MSHVHRWIRAGKIVRLGRARSQGHLIPYVCADCGENRNEWVGY